MGVQITEIGQTKLDRVNAILGGMKNGSEAFKAVSAAMKRASDSAKTQAGRYASETYNISKSKFMGACRITTQMSGGNGGVASVELTFAGKVIKLLEFGARGGPQGPVTVKVKDGGGTLRSAFINAIYGERGVWERVGKRRFPVEQKYGPSTGQMMQDDGVVDKMTEHIEQVFDQRIEHEIWRILNGI